MLLALGSLVVGLSLGIFGGGGSILTVPLLVYGGKLPVQEAIPISLVLVGLTSAAATLHYGRQGLVDWKHGLLFGLFGIAGAAAGAWLNALLPAEILLLAFAALMVAMALLMFRPPGVSPCERVGLGRAFCASVSGTGVGVLTGLLGAGGGFLIVPALVLLLGLEMCRAVATSVLVIALNSASALAVSRPALGEFLAWPWPAFLALALVAAFAGARLAPRLPQAALRKGFAALVLVLGLGILLAEGLGLSR
ncbi:MAG: sulfite exporter TauE/SafE family protein [Deltaproteobacteria bacterium]|nr:sulfite exporter TauE/SafE family protein [Deltaproteobacteria bacterium]